MRLVQKAPFLAKTTSRFTAIKVSEIVNLSTNMDKRESLNKSEEVREFFGRSRKILRFKTPERSYLSNIIWRHRLLGGGAHGISAIRGESTNACAPSQSDSPVDSTLFPIGDKPMEDSFCEVELPFAEDAVLREEYKSISGGLRFGKLLEDLDAVAASVAYLHCDDADLILLTAAVDRIDILRSFDRADLNVRLRGFVTFVGTSSMEVTIAIETEVGTPVQSDRPLDKWQLNALAKFVFVARSKDGTRAIVVPRLILRTQRERDIFGIGQARNHYRRHRNEQSLFKQPPTEEESSLLHRLLIAPDQTHDGPQENGRQVPMKGTEMTSVRLCHPQERNIHNLIFGGHLMREAYELAHSTATIFTAGRSVLTTNVDDISFSHPVQIGSILSFRANIIYTECLPEPSLSTPFPSSSSDPSQQQMIHVEVVADVIDPRSGSRVTTNTFHFTFKTFYKAQELDQMKGVIPSTYTEAMKYLEGKRRIQFCLHSDQTLL